MDISEIIQEYCIPVIAMVVYCICYAIKQTGFVKDKFIPIIALVLGGISGIFMNGLSYLAVAQGIASGAVAVAVHQVFKQLSKDNDYTI